MLLTMRHFSAKYAAQFGINLLIIRAVKNTTDVEIRAVANVKLILLRPADEV